MDDLKFYFMIFLRRLPYFLIVAMIISATSVAVAVSLPPAYVSQMRLVVESPQIPTELAASTVRTPALEQLQIVEQRLLTRANMLTIARQQNVFPEVENMTPDDIVRGMRARARPFSDSEIIGNVKAAVLPVPVCAMPITSRRCKTCGMACAWIGVGAL